MKHTTQKKGLALILAIVMAVALVACGTQDTGGNIENNNAQAPSCEHNWVDANCSIPKTCNLCNATIGNPLDHQFKFENCESKGVCSLCGAETAALGHVWNEATCTAAKTCATCGIVEGDPAPHNYSDNICTECGKVNFEPLTFTGSGDKILSGITLPQGTFVATIKINSTRHYDVKFHLNSDDYELLVNNSGEPYAGTVLLKGSSIEAINDGILEINSKGDWEVKIDMLSGSCTNNITGTGDTITGVFTGTGKQEVITVKIDSTRHYHIRLYEVSTKGQKNDYDLLINDSGEAYSGEVLGKLQAGKQYFFEVNAEGNWSISFGNDPVTQYIDGVVQ